MVPIFAFISPTFIYSFLEEKVQSSNNYLICVDFLLYAREINTKEISSVVLDCKCYLKIQPISSVSLHEVQEMHLWGKTQHCSQFPVGKLNSVAGDSQGWGCQDRQVPWGSSRTFLHTLKYQLEHKQHRGQSSLPAVPHWGSNKARAGKG